MPKASKPNDQEQVIAYMKQLQHPLIREIEMLRDIIKSSDAAIGERIKWNAPSYYYVGEDMVTFNLRDTSQVHLIFHHPTIESISSIILEGDYKGRRMSYFKNEKEIENAQQEIVNVLKKIIKNIRG
jgi:hypothetical protein